MFSFFSRIHPVSTRRMTTSGFLKLRSKVLMASFATASFLGVSWSLRYSLEASGRSWQRWRLSTSTKSQALNLAPSDGLRRSRKMARSRSCKRTSSLVVCSLKKRSPVPVKVRWSILSKYPGLIIKPSTRMFFRLHQWMSCVLVSRKFESRYLIQYGTVPCEYCNCFCKFFEDGWTVFSHFWW